MKSFDLYVDGFNILKRNVVAVVPVVAFFFAAVIVSLLASGIAVASLPGLDAGAGMGSLLVPLILAVAVATLLLSLSIGIIMQGMYVSIAQQGLRGRVSLGRALDFAVKRAKDLFLFNLAAIAIVAVVTAAVVMLFMGSIESLASYVNGYSQGTGTASAVSLVLRMVGTLLPILAVFWLAMFVIGIVLYQAVPLIALERMGPIGGMKRSYAIARKRYLSIIFVQFIGILIFGALYMVQGFFNLIPFVGWIVSIAISVFGSAWMQMIPTLFYFSYVKGGKAMPTG